jgi:excisionase family DNA binding protein
MANVRTMDSIHRPLAVTVSVAAQLLGFRDTKSIYTLIRQGKIRARKSGRIFLISYKSLEDYVEGC